MTFHNFLAHLPRIFGTSLKFRKFAKILVVRQFVGQLGHSIYGNNNLVSFHLRLREAMPKSEKVSTCFVRDCTFLGHLRTTDSGHSCIDSQKCHKLVNWLMLLERINAKLLVTTLIFKTFDKPVILLY